MGIFFAWLRARDQVRPRPLPVADSPDRPARRLYVQFFCLAALGLAAALAFASQSVASQFVKLDYNVYTGSIFRHSVFVELFDDRPLTTANFLQYVNGNKYDGSIMHRLSYNYTLSPTPAITTPFVLQGGGYYPQWASEPQIALWPYSFNTNAKVDLDGNAATPNPTIQGEAGLSPARSNVKGTLAMALSTGPNTATSEWFINLNNNAFLDTSGPFTVFGRIAGDGMTDYVDNLLNKLIIRNMNPDANNDGIRENGPFYTSESNRLLYPQLANSDGTPIYYDAPSQSLAALQIVNAQQIDYFGPGSITVIDGWSLTARDAVIDTGAVFTSPSNSGLQVVNRTLQTRENYSLGRDLSNRGVLDPGLQIGKLTVNNYYQNFDGTLRIDIAGSTMDTQYDRVVATGSAYLEGKLDVNFVNGYMPTRGTSFEIINANAGIYFTFASFDLPSLTAGLVWRISKTPSAFLLTVAGGDYNRNGIVDAADYIVWRDTKGQAVTAGNGADGDGNGIVNDLDYVLWRNNLGNLRGIASGSGAGSLLAGEVPEPTSGLLFVAGIVGIAMHWARRLTWCRPSYKTTAIAA